MRMPAEQFWRSTMHEFLDAWDGWREGTGRLTDEERAERRLAAWEAKAEWIRSGARKPDA